MKLQKEQNEIDDIRSIKSYAKFKEFILCVEKNMKYSGEIIKRISLTNKD